MFSAKVSVIRGPRGRRLTQALSGGTLEQVVDGGADNNTLAAGVDSESTDLDTVTAGNVLDERGLADNLDELLASVTILVEVTDVARSHLLLQGNADGVLRSVSLEEIRANFRHLRRYPGTKQRRGG